MKNLSVRNEGSDIPCKSDVDARLNNVPNVGTNDQTPTYSTATTLAKLVTGEKLGVAFGKIAKAVDELITHLSDSVKHITAEERTAWNGKAAGDHTHAAATQSAAGFMSAHDKTWIDGKLCRRYIYGFDTNDTTHNGWYKICSISTTTANMTYSIRLRISSDNFVNFLVPTIDVTIKFITEAANTSPGVRVHFNSSITDRWTNLFGLLYAKYNTAPSSGGTCTIYFNKKAAYQKIVVDVLDETVRGSTSSALNYQNVWTFDTSNTFVSSVAETGFQVKEFNALVDNGLIGSDVQPVYINAGGAIPCSYQLNATVPADAKFTDTTYSVASQSEAGLMSVADKKKLDSGYVVKSDDGGLYIEI